MSKLQYEKGFKPDLKGKGKEVKDADKVLQPLIPTLRTTHTLLQPKRDKFSGLTRRAKRRKLAMEEDAMETGAIRAAVRSAKKAYRPVKIGEKESKPLRSKASKKQRKKSGAKTGGGFDKDLGQRSSREGVRAKKGDIIGGMNKKKGGKRKAK